MSTRRARIKAVASLPVRRKNNETSRISGPGATGPEKTTEVPRKPDLEPELISSKSYEEPTSPAVKNENKPLHTPKVRRTPTIRTPNLIERVPSTPRSAHASASPRRSSPLARSASPSQKRSPLVKHATPTLANALLQKALQNYKPGIEASKQPQEDYNPPSIPESETEDTVLDGIVPLSNRRPENPINVLKNEIISDYAEVLFDPIVPLPSPSKVRPKLRPAPRFPIRRNSIQGSASESEDEKRAQLSSGSTPAPPRARHDSHSLLQGSLHSLPIVHRELNRVRNDSVCSVGTAGSQATPAGVPASPLLKDKLLSKSRRTEASRRAAAMKRRRAREDVARSEMTMYDLIFYNPTTNPIVRDEEDKVVEAQEEQQQLQQQPKEVEEKVDDPPEVAEESAAPVPQIKLGPNGEIILDEKSLVIEQTEIKRKLSTSIVHESAWASSGKGRYSRARRTADWSPDETVRFYRALAAVGTDFTLMEPLFPGRTRRDLKCKFKKEERLNGAQVDKALRSQTHWDGNRLEGVFTEERRAAAKKAAEDKAAYLEQKRLEKMRMKAAKEDGFRTSRALKAVETVNCTTGGLGEHLTADAFIRKAMATRGKKGQRASAMTEPPHTDPHSITPTPTHEESSFATLTMLKRREARSTAATPEAITPNLAVITPTAELPEMSKNIETGSLVVLTVNDPNNPAKKMLQTYISHGNGKLTPVALPSTLLNSVVSYMKKGTPKSTVSNSPNFMSPNSASQDSTRSSVITLNPSPHKRSRHNSYNITQL